MPPARGLSPVLLQRLTAAILDGSTASTGKHTAAT
jgi:hypothetical protein